MPDFSYSDKGVKIAFVSSNSPAKNAGLKKGDVIVEFNGVPVGNLKEYTEVLKKLKPGDQVPLKYLREGKQYKIRIKIGQR